MFPTRPPQNGATLYQNGAVPGRSRSVLERARPKLKFGTERPGTRNDQISKKWERVERGRARNEVVPSRSQGTSTARERDF